MKHSWKEIIHCSWSCEVNVYFPQSIRLFTSERSPSAVISLVNRHQDMGRDVCHHFCLNKCSMFHANSFLDASSKFSTKSTTQTNYATSNTPHYMYNKYWCKKYKDTNWFVFVLSLNEPIIANFSKWTIALNTKTVGDIYRYPSFCMHHMQDVPHTVQLADKPWTTGAVWCPDSAYCSIWLYYWLKSGQ